MGSVGRAFSNSSYVECQLLSHFTYLEQLLSSPLSPHQEGLSEEGSQIKKPGLGEECGEGGKTVSAGEER